MNLSRRILGFAVAACVGFSHAQDPVYSNGRKASSSERLWKFEITATKKVVPTEADREYYPDLVVKWIVSTKLTNTDSEAKLLLKTPCYGGGIPNEPDSTEFLGGSHLPLQSKAHDFFALEAGASI